MHVLATLLALAGLHGRRRSIAPSFATALHSPLPCSALRPSRFTLLVSCSPSPLSSRALQPPAGPTPVGIQADAPQSLTDARAVAVGSALLLLLALGGLVVASPIYTRCYKRCIRPLRWLRWRTPELSTVQLGVRSDTVAAC